MAIDTNIYKTTLANAALVTPEEWSYEIEQYARELNYFRKLQPCVVVLDRVGVPGNEHTITKNGALTTSALTNGVATEVQALSFNQITVTAGEHGGAVQITNKQLRDELPTIRADVIMGLGEAIADEEEDIIITELMTTTSTTIKVEATLDADSQMDLSTFNRAITAMKTAKRKPVHFVVHTKVEGDMRLLSDFRDASVTGSPYTRLTGFIGTYFGVNIWSTTNIQTSTVNSQTAYNNILLGPRALVIMDKLATELKIDLGAAIERAVTFHVTKDYGVQNLNDESIIIVQSV